MDILSLINKTVPDVCYIDNDIYMPQGSWARFFEIPRGKINVKNWKLAAGNKFIFDVCFVGSFIIKAGISHNKKSFRWIFEKEISSDKIVRQKIGIDLGGFDEGMLEITFVSLRESALFRHTDQLIESPIDEKQILQKFLAPTYELCCEEPLYFRFKGKAPVYSFEKKHVLLNKGEMADLCTYFNTFSLGKWRKYTNLNDLSLYLEFKGKASVELFSVSREAGDKVIGFWQLRAPAKAIVQMPVDFLIREGVLGIKIYAEDNFILYSGGWLSKTKPVRPIKLGICITTYKREKEISATVARLSHAINQSHLFRDAIDIIVVDNGSTLAQSDVPGALLIKNRNYGGTGGFMRGLLHCRQAGGYTHCLFMDDDANCEVESIYRAMTFLSHGKKASLALTGAMLYENIQFLQWENGAWFDGGCHSLNRNLDLRLIKNIVLNEQESPKKIYGAWWFFMFPIAAAKNFSFPYFVRGDDIDFSYNNDFTVTTLNGVAAWQEDFKTKESPLTVYLFIRSHIMHHMNIDRLDHDFAIIDNLLKSHFHRYNDSYDYATAACVNLAIKHVLQGPEFWQKNMEPTEILQQIKEISSLQKFENASDGEAKKYKLARPIKEKIFPYFIMDATLNGHLLPKFMLSKEVQYLPKEKFPGKTFLYKKEKIVVIDEVRRKKTEYQRSVKYYLNNLINFYILKNKLKNNFKNLSELYNKESGNMRKENYWNSVYK